MLREDTHSRGQYVSCLPHDVLGGLNIFKYNWVRCYSISQYNWGVTDLPPGPPGPRSPSGRGPWRRRVPGPRRPADRCTLRCPPAGCCQWQVWTSGGQRCPSPAPSPGSSLLRQTWESKQSVVVAVVASILGGVWVGQGVLLMLSITRVD